MPWPVAFALAPRAPAGALGRRLQHGAGARVLQLAQAERQRVLAALRRQLVHERLDGEHVGEGPERAQRRGADRHGEQPVAGDAPGREDRRAAPALRSAPPPFASGGLKAMKRSNGLASCEAASTVGIGARPARETWPLLHTSPRQPTISPLRVEIGLEVDRHARRPSATRRARPRATIAGAPAARSAARASSTASKATSSAPLWP